MHRQEFELKIIAFRNLHSKGGLLLSNAWDLMSAKLAEAAGDHAIATTSAGVAWSLGYPDGHTAPRDRIMQSAAAIANSTTLPVTIDIENGLLEQGETMIALARDLLAAGVVGVNIEDSDRGASLAVEHAAARLQDLRHSSKSLGFNLFINARIDAYLLGENTDPELIIARANAYLAAGADCIFLPGLTDLNICRKMSQEISAPLNVMALPNGPSAKAFFDAGVCRVSAGPFFSSAAYGDTLKKMKQFRETGQLPIDIDHHLSYPEANALIQGKAAA